MQKSRLILVSLLSLLVIFAPLSTGLANTEPAEDSSKTETELENGEARSPVFEEIEESGGEEVSKKELEEAKGELAWWAAGAATTGLIMYSVSNPMSWNPKEAVRSAGKSVLSGLVAAFTGGLSGLW